MKILWELTRRAGRRGINSNYHDLLRTTRNKGGVRSIVNTRMSHFCVRKILH